MSDGRTLLIAAGWMSVAASLLHLICIAGGPNWYRALGAGEQLAVSAEQGSWTPAIVTAAIAAVIAGWAAYAFSAAGLLPRLPLLQWALLAISLVLLGRGLAGLFPGAWRPDLSLSFKHWSSLIAFAMGLTFALGTWRAWDRL